MEDYMRKLALWHTKTFKPIMNHDDELEPIMAKLGFLGLPPAASLVSSMTTHTNNNNYNYNYIYPSSSSSTGAIAAAAPNINNNHNPSNHMTCTNGGAWKEYVYTAGGCRNPWPLEPLPRPRLPYPRIDGLHQYTYRAFCDAVAFFIGNREIADHFHVRGMPLHRIDDRPFDKKFRSMNEEDTFYVYREGTLDQATIMLFNENNNNKNNKIGTGCSNNSPSPAAAAVNSNKTGPAGNYNSSSMISSSTAVPGCLVPLKDIIV